MKMSSNHEIDLLLILCLFLKLSTCTTADSVVSASEEDEVDENFISWEEIEEYMKYFKETKQLREVVKWLDEYFKFISLGFAAVGNAFILVVMFKYKLRNSATFFICVLSAADALYALSFELKDEVEGMVYERVEQWHCKVVYFFVCYTRQASSWTVVLIAIDRLLVLCLPFKAQKLCSLTRGIQTIIYLGLLLVISNEHILWNTSVRNWNATGTPQGTRCGMDSMSIFQISEWLFLLLAYYIPLSISCCLNCAVVIKLANIVKVRAEMSKNSDRPLRESSDELRLTLMLVVSTIVYMILNMPYVILSSYRIHSLPSTLSLKDKYKITLILTFLRSIMLLGHCHNFLIYIVFNKTFRRKFKEMWIQLMNKICCCSECKSTDSDDFNNPSFWKSDTVVTSDSS